MSKACGYYEELLARLVDDELTAQEEAELRAHLRTCTRCAALGQAMFDLSDVLRDDITTPPAALAEGVMARVRAEAPPAPVRRSSHVKNAKSTSGTGSHAARRSGPVRPWARIAAAACLVLIVGGVAYASLRGRLSPGASAGRGAVMEAAAEEAVLDAGPIPAPAEAPAAAEVPAAAQEPAAMEESAEAELALPQMAAEAQAARSQVTESTADTDGAAPIESVPAGREAEFEAIIRDARRPGNDDYGEKHVILTVEYRGVLYEFLTDEGERELFWRDAAEGVPVLSPELVPALWDIFE